MKRFIAVVLIIQIMILLAGCTIPFFGKAKDEPSSIADGQEMVQVTGDQAKSGGTGAANPAGSGISLDNGSTSDATAVTSGSAANVNTNANTSGAGISPAPASASGMPADAAQTDGGNASSISETPYGTESADTGVLASESGSDSSTHYSEPRRSVTVYYQDGDGALVPMTRWIEPQQGIARAAVGLITDSALNREEIAYYGVYPVLPADTEILGIDIRNGVAVIDFSKNLLNYGSAKAERNIVASVVYTLTEFDTISSVSILINGYPQGIMKYGTDLSYELGREDVAINANISALLKDKDKADVFLLKQANTWYTYPVPVSVVAAEGSASRPEELVKLLLNTVSRDGLTSEMPDGAVLLGADLKDGVISLNFSREFLAYGGTSREEGILKQLAYTLGQCRDIKKIRILVEGRETQLPEGTDISGGLAVPATVNDVMDR